MKMTAWKRCLLLIGSAVMLAACGGRDDADMTKPLPAFESIGQSIARKEDRVTVDELARWIIGDTRDFLVVDIRPAEDFQTGHIENARNLPVASLMSEESLRQLPAGKKIILYSNGSEDAAKSEVMLRLAGYDAYLLLGGYNFWNQHILNPDIPATAADGEIPEVAMQRAISCFFTGDRVAAGTVPEDVPSQPPAFTPPLLPPGEAEEAPEEMGLIVDEGC